MLSELGACLDSWRLPLSSYFASFALVSVKALVGEPVDAQTVILYAEKKKSAGFTIITGTILIFEGGKQVRIEP